MVTLTLIKQEPAALSGSNGPHAALSPQSSPDSSTASPLPYRFRAEPRLAWRCQAAADISVTRASFHGQSIGTGLGVPRHLVLVLATSRMQDSRLPLGSYWKVGVSAGLPLPVAQVKPVMPPALSTVACEGAQPKTRGKASRI